MLVVGGGIATVTVIVIGRVGHPCLPTRGQKGLLLRGCKARQWFREPSYRHCARYVVLEPFE